MITNQLIDVEIVRRLLFNQCIYFFLDGRVVVVITAIPLMTHHRMSRKFNLQISALLIMPLQNLAQSMKP